MSTLEREIIIKSNIFEKTASFPETWKRGCRKEYEMVALPIILDKAAHFERPVTKLLNEGMATMRKRLTVYIH